VTPETLTLIVGGFFSAISAMVIAYVNRQNSSIREQFDALVTMMNLVKTENDRLIAKLKDQERRIKELEDLGEQQAAQIEYLQRELDERDGTLSQVKTWAEMLVKQLRDARIDPVPMPDKERTRPRGATAAT